MTPEQIEKLRLDADAYAQKEAPFCHPLSMRFAQIRDTEFARLATADIASERDAARAEVERLRKILSHIDGLTVIKAKEAAGYGVQVRALSAKEPT